MKMKKTTQEKRRNDSPYIERADGKGLLRDASGKPIPATGFENEPTDKSYESAKRMRKDIPDIIKRLGLKFPKPDK